MDDLSNITSSLLAIIKERLNINDSIFNIWFGDFNLVYIDEEKAQFTTPNDLRKKIVLKKYKTILEDVLEEILDFRVEVEIESLEQTKKIEKPMIDEKFDITGKDKKEEEITDILNNPNLDKKTLLDNYTFDNFIEGASNKFARAACLAVAKEPSTTYNPLFIHGESGLGKTHLLYATMNYMRKNSPGLKIVYVKSETFINELIDAIENSSTAAFKDKYRKVDVLLIDDIQFLAGKVATQEEFFHTFSALYEAEKQIILTSDRPPKEINPLEDRLKTRFEGGVIADIRPPSYELRVAIIKKKLESFGFTLPSDLIEYMADRLTLNIRQIEGVLKKLYAIINLTGTEATKESVDRVISIVAPDNIPTDALVNRIIDEVCSRYGISSEDVKSKKRNENIAGARHVAIYLIREMTDLSLKEIGNVFGRNHATVLSSIDKVDILIKTKNGYEEEIKSIQSKVKGNIKNI